MNTYLSELFSSIQEKVPLLEKGISLFDFQDVIENVFFCDTNVKRTKKISIEKKT